MFFSGLPPLSPQCYAEKSGTVFQHRTEEGQKGEKGTEGEEEKLSRNSPL